MTRMNPNESWDRDGFAVLPNILDPATVAGLREACEHALAQWRETSTADNQPGGFCHGPSAWVMLHLNHARYYTGRRALLTRVLNAIATPRAVEAVTQIMGEPPLFMQANYYIDPPEEATDRGGRWHRDCEFFAYGDTAVERRRFEEEAHPPRELHMHIPLVPTAAIGVVPGSHKRWDTPEQARARAAPYSEMPGGIRLPMEPGDIGLFHVNSIHRGYYEVGVPRRTLSVTFGAQSKHRPFDAEWWRKTRGYVASYQPWFRAPGYLAGVEPHTARLFQRFIDRYGEQWTEENLDAEAIGPARVEYFTEAAGELVNRI